MKNEPKIKAGDRVTNTITGKTGTVWIVGYAHAFVSVDPDGEKESWNHNNIGPIERELTTPVQ